MFFVHHVLCILILIQGAGKKTCIKIMFYIILTVLLFQYG